MNKQEKEYALEVWYDTRFDDARFEKARKISIEALEGKTGQWIPFEYGDDTWHKCTSCGCADKYITEVQRPNGTIGRLKSIRNFCPNCGARMVEPQESEDK